MKKGPLGPVKPRTGVTKGDKKSCKEKRRKPVGTRVQCADGRVDQTREEGGI